MEKLDTQNYCQWEWDGTVNYKHKAEEGASAASTTTITSTA